MRIGESNNIKNLTPILANVFMDGFVLTDKLFQDYQEYFRIKQDELGVLNKYLNNQMSDFEVLAIKKEDNTLKMIVNDLNYCMLAEEIVREKNIEIDVQNLKFPFIFLFKDIKHYSISQVNHHGDLVELNDYSVVRNSQILFDQLIYCDKNTIEIGFSLWKYLEGTGRNFLLLVSAKICNVFETQVELLDKLSSGDIALFKE